MSSHIAFDLDHNRKRLQYYSQLREKNSGKKAALVDKWVAIYEERVQKLEKKATKLGLKVQLASAPPSTANRGAVSTAQSSARTA